jgi:methionyl-tRNA formyltransferase
VINLILSETSRSFIYLKEIIKHEIKINKIILYSKKKGQVFKLIKKKRLNKVLIYYKSNNINSKHVSKRLKSETIINVISVYPGEIVKNYSLLKKKLLHCHPGDLPFFKGSTTIYYSIILKKKLCVTIILINRIIDDGKIIYKKYFNYPKRNKKIEKNFDDKIRSITLIEYLKNKKKIKYSTSSVTTLPYYIAHPIIRQLVLDKKKINI